MIKKKSLRLLRSLPWLFLLPALLAPTARAQKGSLAGVVVDAETGETLIGANVILAGTTTGSTTDLDGRYEIKGLDPGTHDVVFSYIGYDAKTVQGVEVQAGQATRLDLSLTPETIGLDEIVVEAAAVRNAEAALLRERQRAAAVSDAISAEAIGRSGSSTVSDAMQKVTGASVVGGRYVYVRGLGDRYMTTQLNGATLPSADPDRNAVPLDLFSADILDNIVTTKTFTPDKPGSFAGGNVDIGTKAFPESFRFSFASSVGYNTQVTGNDNFLTYPGGGVGSLASDADAHRIPDLWRQRGLDAPPVSDVEARRDPEKAAALNSLAKAFEPVMVPTAGTAPVNRSFSLATGNQFLVFGRLLGYIASLSYDRSYAFYSGGISADYKLTGKVSEKEELDPQLVLGDTRGTSEALLGGLATLSYKLAPSQILSTTVVFNRGAESLARFQSGTLQRDLPTGGTFETRVLGYTERALQSFQLRGDHHFNGLGGLRVEWAAALTTSEQDQPDLRFFADHYRIRERNEGIDTLYAINLSNYTRPSRYFRDLKEDALDTRVNLALPFGQSTRVSGTIKAGGAFNTRARTFREQLFSYQLNAAAVPYAGDPDRFFREQTGVIDTVVTSTGITQYVIGNYIQNATTPGNSYNGDQQIYAGFGMVDVRLLPNLRAIAGVRFEATRIDVASLDPTKRFRIDPATKDTVALGNVSTNDWLPSLNLVYQLRDNMNLRAAYGRTLARPVFRELAPYASFEFIGGRIFIGNPELKRTLVDNYDLRWEWFTRPGEILAVSGFYKYFQNPIELAFVSTNNQVQYQNVDAATVFGAEFEARKRLDNVLPLLSNVEVGGNLTLVHSKVDIPQDELADIRALDPDAPASRALQGQSPFVLNLDVSYAHPKTGTAASLLYNVFGRRLSEISIGGTPDVFEEPAGLLDLIVSQPLMAGFGLKVSAKNLLDARFRKAQHFKGEEFMVQEFERGRSFSISVSYSVD